MKIGFVHLLIAAALICAYSMIGGTGCANITAPTGGKKDTLRPVLIDIDPADSQLNTRVKRIVLDFNKYITVSDAFKEVQLSPILSIPPTVRGINKRVIVKIEDTLLEDNTTYRLSFGNAIKDVHEGNIFSKYVYTFSTGPYFDSLTVSGSVISASTGLPDTGTVIVELYYAKENDSAVVRHKPKYVTRTDATGNFIFKGLPKRNFRIYALKDANGNLVYDGLGEQIAFTERVVVPGDTTQPKIALRLFTELIDTSAKVKPDSLALKNANVNKSRAKTNEANTYRVNLDSTNSNKRTFDINNVIKISFSKIPVLNREKIRLSFDSTSENDSRSYPGMSVPIAMAMDTLHTKDLVITILADSLHPKPLHVSPSSWHENTLYTLRLTKGFAADTTGTEFLPARFVFRTLEEDDYGKITVHLPTRYSSNSPGGSDRLNDSTPDYVLMVVTDKDTVYQHKITDTLVLLTRLAPAKYTFRVIVDKNKNGKWDTGDLLAKKQPEEVVPYRETLTVKAGWEYTVDFEQKPEEKEKK